MLAFRNKLYLQMLIDDTFLLAPSTRDLCILSCMLKTVSIKFLRILCLYFLYSYGIPREETLMFFAGCFFLAQGVF